MGHCVVFIVLLHADTLVYQWCCIYRMGSSGEHQHWSSNCASASGQDLRKRCWILRAHWAGLWVPPPSSIFRLLSRNDRSATRGASYKEPDQRRAIDHIKAHRAEAWIMKCWLWRKTAGQKTTKYESWRAANNKGRQMMSYSHVRRSLWWFLWAIIILITQHWVRLGFLYMYIYRIYSPLAFLCIISASASSYIKCSYSSQVSRPVSGANFI